MAGQQREQQRHCTVSDGTALYGGGIRRSAEYPDELRRSPHPAEPAFNPRIRPCSPRAR